ncbi:MAG TPA: PAS domain-containing protein [Sphingomonas sp.]|nr:PAS domain-containing protein [Sphingomonas sp.]
MAAVLPDHLSAAMPGFLTGGGAIGERMRAIDWSRSALGMPESWPLALQSAVSLMLNSKFPMFVAWGDGLTFLYNDAYAPVLGGKHPAALGRPFQQVWSEIWADLEPLVTRALDGEATWLDDLPLTMRRNGYDELTYFTFSYSPVRDEGGEVRGLFCACTETTEKVEAVRRNAAERERIGDLFAKAPAFMASLSGPEHVFEFVNPAYLQLVGHRDIVGKSVREALPEVAGQGFFELLDDVYASGEPFIGRQLSLSLQRERGGPFTEAFLDFVYQPVRDEAGAVNGIFVSGYDVTDLRQAQDRLTLAQRAGNIGAFEVYPATRMIAVTPEFCDLWGVPVQDMLSLDEALAAVHPDDRDRVRTGEEQVKPDAMGYIEYRIIRPDNGEVRWIARRAEGLQEDGDNVVRFAGVVYDITDKRRVEEELRLLNETLEQRVVERTAELEHAHEALRQAQKMEAVGQLTGGIAHDFNNLLTGVIGSLDLLQRKLSMGRMSELDRHVTAATTAANRAAALTHRLLAFSRRQPLDPRPVNANRLVTSIEELLRRTIGESVHLEIVTAGGLWQTLCDPHQLESALLNLAINARDAMPEGGKLTIETCNAHLDTAYAAQSRDVRPGQYVCICVSDTGTGMDKDTIAKAFEPFFTTKPIGQGTGLGLSMIYGFARQSNGYAKIYSEVGDGTTFKLYLPRHYGAGEEEFVETAAASPEHIADHGDVVLVVEDETAVRDLVAEVLTDLGYHALEAVDGPSGLAILQSNQRIDMLVTDVGLPGLNGRQLADAARLLRPGLKILFMTGYAENAAVSGGFLEPGMELLTKPFAIEALVQKLQAMVADGGARSRE